MELTRITRIIIATLQNTTDLMVYERTNMNSKDWATISKCIEDVENAQYAQYTDNRYNEKMAQRLPEPDSSKKDNLPETEER